MAYMGLAHGSVSLADLYACMSAMCKAKCKDKEVHHNYLHPLAASSWLIRHVSVFLPDHIIHGHWRVRGTFKSPERRIRCNTKEDLTIGELLRDTCLNVP